MSIELFLIRILYSVKIRWSNKITSLRSMWWRGIIQIYGGSVGRGFVVQKGAQLLITKGARIQIGVRFTLAEDAKLFLGAKSEIIIEEDVFIGRGSTIVSNYSVSIGSRTQIAHHVTIIDSDHRFDETTTPLLEQGGVFEKVEIARDVWVGANAILLKGVHIGSFTTVGAGSVVTKSAPPKVTIAGNPAREIRKK